MNYNYQVIICIKLVENIFLFENFCDVGAPLRSEPKWVYNCNGAQIYGQCREIEQKLGTLRRQLVHLQVLYNCTTFTSHKQPPKMSDLCPVYAPFFSAMVSSASFIIMPATFNVIFPACSSWTGLYKRNRLHL